MPKVIKKRVRKTLTPEEEIKETVEDIKEKIKTRQRTLAYFIGIFFILITFVIAFIVYNRTSSAKALELQSEGYKLFYGEYLTSLIQPTERYQKALDLFKKSYEKRKRPDTLLYIANCYYELGNYDEAIKSLNLLIEKFSEPKLVSMAYYKIAMAYMKKNDQDKALSILKNISGIKNGSFQDIALFEVGNLLESIGKTEEAKASYRELINKFPKSGLVNEAKKRLGE
jgi:tetratricopeptide (TPR) repeat protein